MPLVTMRQILDHAAENNYGVPAVRFLTMPLRTTTVFRRLTSMIWSRLLPFCKLLVKSTLR